MSTRLSDAAMKLHKMPLHAVMQLIPGTSRREFIRDYGFALPCKEAFDAMRGHRIFDPMAGTGYWAKLLQEDGFEVSAYDAKPTLWRQHFDVKTAEVSVSMLTHQDWSVLLSWPPYGDDADLQCFERMAPGQTLFLVGELGFGCTGSNEGFEYLEGHFDLHNIVDIPTFEGLHDVLTIWRKK